MSGPAFEDIPFGVDLAGSPIPTPPPLSAEEERLLREAPKPQAAAQRSENDKRPTASIWTFENIVQVGAEPPRAPDVYGLFYRGQRHVVIGEGGAGKTWLLLAAAADELRGGHAVVWIDSDGGGPNQMLERLRSLGVSADAIAERFLYVYPETGASAEVLADLVERVEKGEVRLLVVDSFDPMLQLYGLDPNKTVDVDALLREFATPLARAGAAVVFLDHVVKAADSRGSYAIGSQRKQTGPEVNLLVRVIEPLARGLTGRLRLTVGKDRVGFLGPKGTVVGVFRLASKADRCTASIVEDVTRGDDGFRPTGLMESVSRFLEAQVEPVSLRTVRENVRGKTQYVNEAVEVLKREGYAGEQEGSNRSRLFTSARAYRKASELDETGNLDDEELGWFPSGSQPGNHPAEPVVPVVVPGSPPLGGNHPGTVQVVP